MDKKTLYPKFIQKLITKINFRSKQDTPIIAKINSKSKQDIPIIEKQVRPVRNSYPINNADFATKSYVDNYSIADGAITTIKLADANVTKAKLEASVQTSLGKADNSMQANTAITGATKTKITYDTKGLVTVGADLVATDIPDLAASKITSGLLPITRGGTGAATVGARFVLIGTGTASTAPTWRAIVGDDLPGLDTGKLTSGILPIARGGTGIATSTTANRIFATATSGTSATAPSFRALVAADIPEISTDKLTSGTLPLARGGTGAATISAGLLTGYSKSSSTGAIAATDSIRTALSKLENQTGSSPVVLDARDMNVLTTSQGGLNTNPFYQTVDKDFSLTINGNLAVLNGYLKISPSFVSTGAYWSTTGTFSIPVRYMPLKSKQTYLFLVCCSISTTSAIVYGTAMYTECPSSGATGNIVMSYRQPATGAGTFDQCFINGSWVF